MKKLSIFIALSLMLVPAAFATATLTIDDPTTVGIDISLTDSDNNGVIYYNSEIQGAVSTWVVTIATGITKPTIGSIVAPNMHFDTVDVSSSAGGTLVFTFTDDGFNQPSSLNSYLLELSTTTSGTSTYSAFQNGTLIGTLGPLSGNDAASGTFGQPSGTPFYTLANVITVTHTSGGTTSLDAELTAVPEPSALLLLGSGLAALGIFRLRKRS